MNIFSDYFIHDHKNPVMKVEISGAKLFLKPSSQESDVSEKCLANLYKVLRYSRVEKRYVNTAFLQQTYFI